MEIQQEGNNSLNSAEQTIEIEQQLVKENGSATFSFDSLMDKLNSIENSMEPATTSGVVETSSEQKSKNKKGKRCKKEKQCKKRKFASSSTSDEEEASASKEQKKLEKEARRAAKKQRREEKAEERKAKKLERKAEKEKQKQERKLEKEAAKASRKQTKKEENSEDRAAKRFAEGVSYLYLDGNNMLYVADPIRKLAGRKRSRAEQLLLLVVTKFHQKLGNLTHTELMFDTTKLPSGTTDGVELSNAKKKGFSISDDALVDLAKKLGPEEAKKSVFVTSDRELKTRLAATGATTLGPKGFLTFAFQKVNEDPAVDSLNAWLDKLTEANSL